MIMNFLLYPDAMEDDYMLPAAVATSHPPKSGLADFRQRHTLWFSHLPSSAISPQRDSSAKITAVVRIKYNPSLLPCNHILGRFRADTI